QYSFGDYVATFFGFLGLSIPNFLLALVLMYVSAQYFCQSTGGLFSPAYINAVWSWAKRALRSSGPVIGRLRTMETTTEPETRCGSTQPT
ncbi:hypothetical protein ACC754_39105, partial [Rhizobium johnstonii]